MRILESSLEAVTVFARGAICTRRARIPVEAGRLGRVRIENLPLSLVADSIRVRVLGEGTVSIGEVRADFTTHERDVAELPELERALDEAQAQLSQLGESLARVEKETRALCALRPKAWEPAEGAPPKPAALQGFLALAGLVDSELTSLGARQLELEQQLEDTRRKISDLEIQKQERSSALSGASQRLSRAVEIALNGEASESVELALEYAVEGATWLPSYALRLEPGLAKGRLEARARVAQRTGEDWSGVRLSLSTADLARRVELPKLQSLRIGRAQSEPRRPDWRPPPADLEVLFVAYLMVRAQQPRPTPPFPQPVVRMATAYESKLDASEERELEPEEDLDGAEPDSAYGLEPAMDSAVGAAPKFSAPSGAPPPARSISRPRAAPMKEKAKRARRSVPPPPPPAPPQPDLSWLDYGVLEMSAPEEANRGTLRRADTDAGGPIGEAVRAARTRASELERKLEEAGTPSVRQSAGHYDDRYDAAHPVQVPADGAWHLVSLFEPEVSLSAELVCVPSVDPKVFRTLRVENHSAHALLRGPVDVMVDGAFLMNVPLPTLPPGGAERLGLGVEESVQVARNTRFQEESGGLLGGSLLLSHQLEVEAVNRLPRPVSLCIRERVPVTSDKEIRVEEAGAEPPWTPDAHGQPGAPVEGARAWRVELKPGERKQLSARFQIKLPSGRMLEGGNRRL